jgi:hypothetical protein
MITIFAKTSISLSKNAKFFGKNILKIITSVPGHLEFESGDRSSPFMELHGVTMLEWNFERRGSML